MPRRFALEAYDANDTTFIAPSDGRLEVFFEFVNLFELGVTVQFARYLKIRVALDPVVRHGHEAERHGTQTHPQRRGVQSRN